MHMSILPESGSWPNNVTDQTSVGGNAAGKEMDPSVSFKAIGDTHAQTGHAFSPTVQCDCTTRLQLFFGRSSELLQTHQFALAMTH